MVATAEAQPNIALIKYWGKQDLVRNLPAVSSVSITLSHLRALTAVRADEGLTADRLLINGVQDQPSERRVQAALHALRVRTGVAGPRLDVTSEVNFPVAAGLASSAAGFAALVVAADEEYGTQLDRHELARLAGAGSGSAARSLYGGFVRLIAPDDSSGEILVEPLAAPEHWPLAVVIAVTDDSRKPVGSTEAMLRTAESSVFYERWIETQSMDIDTASRAIQDRDFEKLADVSEASCLKMHALIMSSRPGIVYWNAATVELIHTIRSLRAQGVATFFTIDAGPQVKAVCAAPDAAHVIDRLASIDGVCTTLTTGLGAGARVIS